MKKITILCLLLFSTLTFAFEKKLPVVIRDKDFDAVERDMVLKDLISKDSFEGKYFKIVIGRNENAIKFSDSEFILLRAATTYYHLTKARNFFVNQLKSTYVKDLPQITVRIEHTAQYHRLGHYKNKEAKKIFNNAKTIPANPKGFPRKNIPPWGNEVWFSPSKVIHIKDLNLPKKQSGQEIKRLMEMYRKQLHSTNFQKILVALALAVVNGTSGSSLEDSLIRTGGTSILMEIIYQSSGTITELFQKKQYHADTALVPEIIYHEFTHIALSNHLVPTNSTAVIEGMADYFAGVIGGNATLAGNIKKYNTYKEKDGNKDDDFILLFETEKYANSDFVFSILWGLRHVLNDKKEVNRLVMETTKKITTYDNIRADLVDAIMSAIWISCEDPMGATIKIAQYLDSRGL